MRSKYEQRLKEAMRLLREARYLTDEVAADMEDDALAGIKSFDSANCGHDAYVLLMQQSGQMREVSEDITHARERAFQLRKNIII
ncbi:MAG: hypothetical protein ACXWQ5_00085 [Ktedonobacterales bacterium]